jgi:hypothetical protein
MMTAKARPGAKTKTATTWAGPSRRGPGGVGVGSGLTKNVCRAAAGFSTISVMAPGPERHAQAKGEGARSTPSVLPSEPWWRFLGRTYDKPVLARRPW